MSKARAFIELQLGKAGQLFDAPDPVICLTAPSHAPARHRGEGGSWLTGAVDVFAKDFPNHVFAGARIDAAKLPESLIHF